MCVQSLQHKPRGKRPRTFTQSRVANSPTTASPIVRPIGQELGCRSSAATTIAPLRPLTYVSIAVCDREPALRPPGMMWLLPQEPSQAPHRLSNVESEQA